MPVRKPTNRREFLRLSVLSAASAAIVAACGPAPAPTATSAPAKPAETPKPAAAAPTPTSAPAKAGEAPKPAEAAKPTAATTPASPAKAAAGTIRQHTRGDAYIFKVFGNLRDEFYKTNDKIKVEIDESPADWYQKLQLQIASGTPPDCVFECDCTITTTVRAGALEPLDDYLKAEKRYNKDDYWEMTGWASMYKGKLYGLAWDGGSMALFYNKDLFDKAGIKYPDPVKPITWDEMLQYAKEMTLDADGRKPTQTGFDPKRVRQYGLNPNRGIFQIWIFGNGGEIVGQDGSVPIDEPAAAEGLQYLADLGAKHYVSPSPEFQLASPVGFASGTVAMEYNGVWSAGRYRDSKINYDVAPFPQGKVRVSTGWYSPLSMLAASKLKDAVWEWMWFNFSESGQKLMGQLGQNVPTVKKLAESKEYFLNPKFTPPEHKEVFLTEMNGDWLRVPGDKYGSYFGGYVQEFRDMFNPAFDPVWAGKRTAAEVAKEMRPKLELLLKTGKTS